MLSEHDLELLSAYLDGALNQGERTALEARLQTEPELRRELARLRATVDLIKTLPTLTSPRPLTLTPRMVRRPTVWTSAAFSAMSAAAAVILLIIGAALFATSPTQLQSANAVVARVAQVPTATAALTAGKQGGSGGNNAPIPTLPALEAQSDALQLSETQAATEQFLFSAQAPQENDADQQAQNGAIQPQAQSAIVPPVFAASSEANVAQAAPQAMSNSAAAGGAALPELAQAPTAAPTDTPTATPSPTETFTATLTSTNTPSPSETASPTATPVAITILPATPETSTVGIGLIVVAVILFGAAIVTSVIRRRT